VSIWRRLLAAMFLFAGAMKLVLPIEAMAGPIGLPGGFLASSAFAETFGAIFPLVVGPLAASVAVGRSPQPIAA